MCVCAVVRACVHVPCVYDDLDGGPSRAVSVIWLVVVVAGRPASQVSSPFEEGFARGSAVVSSACVGECWWFRLGM